MTNEEFNFLVSDILTEVRGLVQDKKTEYAKDLDVLINFKHAANRRSEPEEKILKEWVDKHVNSIDLHFREVVQLPLPKIKEKVKDIIVYSMLLYALEVEKQGTI